VRRRFPPLPQGILNIVSTEIENDRLRHIRLHERVNELPDPNYSTLKYFLGHLHRFALFLLPVARR
jgi:hypothetical protein